MLGSTDDAEDMVQETLVRAWRSLATHDAQASFRSWLYKIATNKCLKLIERRPARVLAQDFGPAADPLLPPSPPTSEVVQLDPYPNALLGELMAVAPDPEAIYLLRESIELAFLTAIQLLPARQRAVLILRDVLGWRTSEVAALMDSSAASVTSALQRARATMADRVPTRERAATSRAVSEAVQESVLASYMAAWEHGDMNALAVLLKKDALLTMAPAPNWFRGREAIANFFHSLCFSDRRKRFRLLATGANGQPACAAYEWDEDDGCYRFSGIMALTLEANEIAEITGFGDHGLFALFGLPETLGTD
jgi:RNA polymerase sigma-70 factor (ECF subfamily)